MKLHIAIEANAGHGQDAAVYGSNYAFVFDGLGGTGGKTCIHRDGRRSKEAKVASRAAAEAVGKVIDRRWESWAQQIAGAARPQLERALAVIRTELKQEIDEALLRAAGEWNALSGTMPTTVAGWITFPQADGQTLAVSIWAGDSRCYTLDDQCMKLCTLDDVDEKYREDAMQELLGSGSPPMNNRAGINYSYHLNASCRSIFRRTMLMCCTDGIYGGMDSPMHMEHALRLFALDESIEDMVKGWEDFFTGNGLLQDDAATMEMMFVDAATAEADEAAKLQAMREMLTTGIEELEKEYIEKFPEYITDETVDVDGKIGSLARQMCSKRGFHSTLRKNAVEIIRKGKSFPDDLPCAKVLRQMQEEQRGATGEKRVEMRRQVIKAQQELNDYVAGLDIGEQEPYYKSGDMTPEAGMKIRQNRVYEFLRDAEIRFVDIIRNMQNWYFPSTGFGAGFGVRRPSMEEAARAVDEMDSVMRDMCVFINEHFNMAPKPEGYGRLRLTRTGKTNIRRRKGSLSPADQQDLKMTVRRMVENGETMDETLFENKSWPLPEVANIVLMTEKVIKAERDLARFEKNPSADKEPSTAALDDYLKSHPNSDARYFIADWIKQGKKPTYFQLTEKDLVAIHGSVITLMECIEANEKIRERHAERRQTIMKLWAQYKPTHEAWDEAVKAADVIAEVIEEANPIEEAQAAIEAAEPVVELAEEVKGEVKTEAEPAIGEAMPQAQELGAAVDGEAVVQQAKTEEQPACAEAAALNVHTEEDWTDCESIEIHE